MEKNKEHLLIGGAIVVLALLFLWYYEKNKVATNAPSSTVEQVGGTPLYSQVVPATLQPVAQSSNSVVPGVQIKMGNIPVNLTYNIPQSLSGHLNSAPRQSQSQNPSYNNYQGCCPDSVTPQTFDNFLNSPSVQSAAIDNYNNLQSTGLLQ